MSTTRVAHIHREVHWFVAPLEGLASEAAKSEVHHQTIIPIDNNYSFHLLSFLTCAKQIIL